MYSTSLGKIRYVNMDGGQVVARLPELASSTSQRHRVQAGQLYKGKRYREDVTQNEIGDCTSDEGLQQKSKEVLWKKG